MKRLLICLVGVFLFVLVGCRQSGNQAIESGDSSQMGARLQLDKRGLTPPRNDVTIKINSSRTANSLEPENPENTSPLQADTGKQFLIVSVTVTNRGTKPLFLQGMNFRILATDKQEYRGGDGEAALYKNFKPISANLMPGGTETGDVAFEVNTGAELGTVEMVKTE